MPLLKLTLLFLYTCLIFQSVHNEELDDDDNDDDIDDVDDDDDVQEVAVRRRRNSCENPMTKNQSKFYFQLLYGAGQKGKTSYVHDRILLFKPYQVTGWTIKGKTGDADSKHIYRKPGYLKEYVMYYLPVNGRWTKIQSPEGNEFFTNNVDDSAPDKEIEVSLSQPVVTSVLRLYPQDWEGAPYSTISVKYCEASQESLTAKKLWRPTLPPTPKPTTTTTTTATPAQRLNPAAEERIVQVIEHAKEAVQKEKQEKKLLKKALKKLAKEKKEIKKMIKEAKKENTMKRPKYDREFDDIEYNEFQ